MVGGKDRIVSSNITVSFATTANLRDSIAATPNNL